VTRWPHMEGQRSAFHHSEAAKMLGVSPATLRRLAKFYEEAFEPMPTDARGGRVYPDHALKRMQAARSLFDEGRAASLETAFSLLARGETGNSDEIIFQANARQPNEQLLLEFRGVRRALEQMSERLDTLQEENAQLREQVLKQLEAPNRIASNDTETTRMNQYLLGELERRRLEAEAQQRRRPWWQLWDRR